MVLTSQHPPDIKLKRDAFLGFLDEDADNMLNSTAALIKEQAFKDFLQPIFKRDSC